MGVPTLRKGETVAAAGGEENGQLGGDGKLWIQVEDRVYDVTNFKHPGGNVINYMLANEGADATSAFEEFHTRSKKAKLFLRSLPSKEAPKKTEAGRGLSDNERVLANFAKFRAMLVRDGYFEPSITHVGLRVTELVFMFGLGIYLFSTGNGWLQLLAVLLHGVWGGRCGWLQHEGGHSSLTGNIWWDKRIQHSTIGFGLGACGDMWNSMHNKHHATPQKIGHDLDLDTTPLAAFFNTACEDNRPRPFLRLWLRFQAWTFLPVTSGMIVMAMWLLFLHPRKVIRERLYERGFWMLSSHVVRTALISHVTGWSIASSYAALWACFWVSGIYLFGHFSLSHTHLPVVDREEHKTWVHYAVEHTADINPDNPLINWIMGYLNCQVLHHLFPNMPQFRQPAVSKLFRKFAKDNGLNYIVMSYAEAWAATMGNLDHVGHHYHENGFDHERAKQSKADVGRMRNALKAH